MNKNFVVGLALGIITGTVATAVPYNRFVKKMLKDEEDIAQQLYQLAEEAKSTIDKNEDK